MLLRCLWRQETHDPHLIPGSSHFANINAVKVFQDVFIRDPKHAIVFSMNWKIKGVRHDESRDFEITAYPWATPLILASKCHFCRTSLPSMRSDPTGFSVAEAWFRTSLSRPRQSRHAWVSDPGLYTLSHQPAYFHRRSCNLNAI